MSCKDRAAILVMVASVAAPAGASAFVGGPGCTNLPEYNRALGALQGMESACDMSVEQARRVIADHDGSAAAPRQAAPRPRGRPARHRVRIPQR